MRGGKVIEPHRYWMDTALQALGRLRELDSELIRLNRRIEELQQLCDSQIKRIQELEKVKQ